MPITSKDLLLTVRNGTNTRFAEIAIGDDPVGFIGFDASGDVSLEQVKNEDIDAAAAISFSKLQNLGATNKILGRISVGDGSTEILNSDDIITILNNTGTIPLNNTVAPGGSSPTIANNTVLGNTSGSSAAASEQTSEDLFDILNTASTNTLGFSRINNVAQHRILGSITVGSNPVTALTADNIVTLLNAEGTTAINGTVTPGGSLSAIADNTLLGNTSGSSATPTEQTANDVITLLGTSSNALTLTQIPSITYAKIQNISGNNRVLGRITSGAGSTEELTPNNLVTILNTGSTALNTTIAPGPITPGNFTALTRTVALGTVTTTQTIDVTSTTTPIRLFVTATLSSANVIFNFTNLVSGLAGMEIILTITNDATSRNVTIQETGADTNTTSGISGYAKPTNIPSGATGNTIFGMVWDGSKLHVNNLKYSSTVELNAGTENKSKVYEHWTDFENGVVGSIFTSSTAGTGASSGAVANTSNSTFQIGVHRCATGTTATGRGSFLSASSILRFGQGTVVFEAKRVAVSQLITAAVQEYFLDIGFIDTVTAEPVDGVYFEYSVTNPTTWTICTANNSTRTKTNSASTIVATTLYNLRIEVNAAGNSVTYYVNDVSVGTITTNIPTAFGRETGIGFTMRKTVGTTSITADIDSLYVKYVLTNTR